MKPARGSQDASRVEFEPSSVVVIGVDVCVGLVVRATRFELLIVCVTCVGVVAV